MTASPEVIIIDLPVVFHISSVPSTWSPGWTCSSKARSLRENGMVIASILSPGSLSCRIVTSTGLLVDFLTTPMSLIFLRAGPVWLPCDSAGTPPQVRLANRELHSEHSS